MADAPTLSNEYNVIPVWGLLPDECRYIRAQADELISRGIASGLYTKMSRTYICIFDNCGAPYTIAREQRLFRLLDPSGDLITINENLDAIMATLIAYLQKNGPKVVVGAE